MVTEAGSVCDSVSCGGALVFFLIYKVEDADEDGSVDETIVDNTIGGVDEDIVIIDDADDVDEVGAGVSPSRETLSKCNR